MHRVRRRLGARITGPAPAPPDRWRRSGRSRGTLRPR
jgi:hypothetical protein